METGKRTERTMGLTICNGFSSTISFAIGWPDSSQCANSGKWKKRGWWNVAPGQCARVYGSSLKASVEWLIMVALMIEAVSGEVVLVLTSLTLFFSIAGTTLLILNLVDIIEYCLDS